MVWTGRTQILSAILVTDHVCLFFNSVLPYYIADAVSSYKWFEGMLTSNKSNADFISGMYLKYILNSSTFVTVILKDHYRDPGKWESFQREEAAQRKAKLVEVQSVV